MAATSTRLDLARMGSGAEGLEHSLSKLIVGQVEAIRAIAGVHQMY